MADEDSQTKLVGSTDQNDKTKRWSYLNYLEAINREERGNLIQARRSDFVYGSC